MQEDANKQSKSVRKYLVLALLAPFLVAALTLLACLPFLESFSLRQWVLAKIEIRNASGKASLKRREIAAARKQLFYAEIIQVLQGDLLTKALAELELARVLLSANKFQECAEHARASANILKDLALKKSSIHPLAALVHEELVSSLSILGLSEEELGRKDMAIKYYEKARHEFNRDLSQPEKAGRSLIAREVVDMLRRYCQCLQDKGESTLSNEVRLEAIELCRQQGNLEFLERQLRKELVETAAGTDAASPNRKNGLKWQSLIDESDQLSSQKQFEAALQKLNEASQLAGDAKAGLSVADGKSTGASQSAGGSESAYRQVATYVRMATVYMDLFQYENSLTFGLKAVSLTQANEQILQKLSERELSYLYKSTSLSAYKLDRYEGLATIFEKAWQQQTKEEGQTGIRSLFAEARYALALARNLQFEQARERAETCFEELSKISQQHGKQLGLSLKLVGEAFFEAGSYKQSAASFARAYENFVENGGEESGYANVGRAELCAALYLAGNKAQAKALVKKNQEQFASWSTRSREQKESLIKQTLYLPSILKKLKRNEQAKECLELLRPSLNAVDSAAGSVTLAGL